MAATTEVEAPAGADPDRFARAIAAIDAANAGDPFTIVVDGVERPKEQAHAEAMVTWVRRFDPAADEAQLLAARAHHLRRWDHPRDSEPEGRAGYLRWRAEAKRRHAALVGNILAGEGYDAATIERVQDLVAKKGLGRGDRPDVDGRPDPFQVHEDALCLVFLTTQFDDLVAKLGDDRTVDVLARTLPKMGDRGRAAALALDLTDHQQRAGRRGARAPRRRPTAAARALRGERVVNCARCGQEDVVVGSHLPVLRRGGGGRRRRSTRCSRCPAEAVEELDEQATGLPMLTVEPGSVGAATELDGTGDGAGDLVLGRAVAGRRPRSRLGVRSRRLVGSRRTTGPRAPTPTPGPPTRTGCGARRWRAPPPRRRRRRFPRRTPLAETTAQWGPRDHPPAVLAPPPPHPLDAPAVARVKRPSGTGLPPGVAAGRPGPGAERAPRADCPRPSRRRWPRPVPERPTHPRVRRWFGRGAEADPRRARRRRADRGRTRSWRRHRLEGPFAGAPDGLLDGVVAEPDLGPGVHDPAGVDAAMSRLSAGARRSALAPMAIVAALLEVDEVAEAVVEGEYQHRPAVAVLTDRRVIVANDRRWAPDVRTFGFTPSLVVHGWQDDRRATLVFVLDGVGVVVEAISDRPAGPRPGPAGAGPVRR